MLDGILEAMQAAGLGAGALRVRNVPLEREKQEAVIGQRIEELLDESDEPTALLCRNTPTAEVAANYLKARDIGMPKPFLLVYNAVPIYGKIGWPGCRCVNRCCTVEDEFEMLGRILHQRQQKDAPWPESMVLPVTAVTS